MDPHSWYAAENRVATEAGLRGPARRRFQPGDRAAARPGLEAVGPDHLGVRAAPWRDASTTARRSPPKTWCSASSARAPRHPTSDQCRWHRRRSRRSMSTRSAFTTAGARSVAVAEARRVAIMSKAWADAARCDEARRLQPGARGDLRLAPRQWHRAVHARRIRAPRPLGHGPQSRVVGRGRLSAQHRPHRPHLEATIRRTLPPCSRARSICSRKLPYSALDQIRGTAGLKLAHRTKLLTMYFGLDQGSAELRSSNVKGRNPFKDKRVRQAMACAIDHRADPPPPHG